MFIGIFGLSWVVSAIPPMPSNTQLYSECMFWGPLEHTLSLLSSRFKVETFAPAGLLDGRLSRIGEGFWAFGTVWQSV